MRRPVIDGVPVLNASSCPIAAARPGEDGRNGFPIGRAPEASTQVLVVDYPGRRESGHISDLGLERDGFDVRYPLQVDLPRQVRVTDYARQVIQLANVDPGRLGGILAYCMAGPIAFEVAVQLAVQVGVTPPVVLFDSGPCTTAAIAAECRSALLRWGGARDAGAFDGAFGHELFSTESLGDRPEWVLRTVEQALLAYAVRLYGAEAGDDPRAIEVVRPTVDQFVAWLSHLIAAHNSGSAKWSGHVLHITSREHPIRADWPGARSTSIRVVHSDRRALLGDRQVRDLVISHLRSSIRST